jgi:hypothetical protein
MDKVELISVTHANMDTRIHLVKGLISGYYYSPNHKCTMIVSTGGAVFPAKETTDELETLLLKGEQTNVGTN